MRHYAGPMEICVDAVLFDMDGTLVNSTPVVERVWIEFAERYQLDAAEVLTYAHGRQTRDTVTRFLPAGNDPDLVTAELQHSELTDLEGIIEIPGAASLFAQLPPAGVAVVTSASRDLAEARLRAAGVPVPAVMVCASDVSRGKPDPEGYLQAARRLGVAPESCLVLEDAEAGVRSGLASGARVIIVGGHQSDATADLPRVPDLTAVSATSAAAGIVIRW